METTPSRRSPKICIPPYTHTQTSEDWFYEIDAAKEGWKLWQWCFDGVWRKYFANEARKILFYLDDGQEEAW